MSPATHVGPAIRRREQTPHLDVTSVVTGHFRKGKGYYAFRPEGTRDWLLILTLGGHGRVGHAGGELTVRRGDAILLAPRTLHDYGVEPTREQWELLWAHFQPRPEWHDWLGWPTVAPGLFHLRPPVRSWREIVGRMRETHRLSSASTRRRDQRALNALEDVLLRLDAVNPLSDSERLDPRVRAVLDYVDANLVEPSLHVGKLAAVAALSQSRFAHLFREQLQTTPQQYIERRRLLRARDLLARTGLSVKEVAAEVGFRSPFYFSLRFRKHVGRSPSEYRRTSRES
jgi:AraC family transcriptional regulator of arabinose operon